jgi:hypothetical protein
MKNLHCGRCIIGVAIAAALLVALGVSAGTLGVVAVAVACPLMMFVMMRAMMGDHAAPARRHDQPVDRQRNR